MPDRAFTLLSKEEILQRLLKVDDNSYTQEKLYPLLTECAGEQKTAKGLVIMLQLAIFHYAQRVPAPMGATMSIRIPNFIDALCPDEEVAAEAKAFFKRAMAAK